VSGKFLIALPTSEKASITKVTVFCTCLAISINGCTTGIKKSGALSFKAFSKSSKKPPIRLSNLPLLPVNSFFSSSINPLLSCKFCISDTKESSSFFVSCFSPF